ncbi:helix-turn-helix domain-containing protein [Aliiroseovarius sp. 2305UL8-7]|uniref:helix-turn-helix domain-containing protein n=1 Tax=Aliiroseovarius conchicola TaxID=3121637 RepID=UPI0035277DE3
MNADVDIPFPFFGRRLRQARRAMGMKQLALAHSLNVDQATVSRWESERQTPEPEFQRRAFEVLAASKTDDAALRRLVEKSSDCVHLVEEASHICLAYSRSRAKDWRTSQRNLLGVSLWQFATDEIRQAEAELVDSDWWSVHMPKPKSFCTSESVHDKIRISAGGIRWERLYLADGTPVRLVSGT